MKHTQGEWKAIYERDQIHIDSDENINIIALIEGRETEDDANAKLIAAAPDLLKRLQSSHETLLRAIQYLGSKDPVLAEVMSKEILEIEQTIKKATE